MLRCGAYRKTEVTFLPKQSFVCNTKFNTTMRNTEETIIPSFQDMLLLQKNESGLAFYPGVTLVFLERLKIRSQLYVRTYIVYSI